MRAAAIQMTATDDRAANLERADALVRRAASDGATLVVLPEKWSAYGSADVARRSAEELDGPALTWARAIAAELRIDLIAGSIPERGKQGGRGHNTSVHIGPDGRDRASYRKLHMFDVVVGGREYRESDAEAPGAEIALTQLAGGFVAGMAICYDLRFPEQFAAMTERGAEVLVLPAAFTLSTTRDHWEVLVRARAIENQCFVVAANQTGEHAPRMRSGGTSMIVDPWGKVLAALGTEEGVAVADLDMARLRQVRRTLPSFANRRPDVY